MHLYLSSQRRTGPEAFWGMPHGQHTLLCSSDGGLLAVGNNGNGQLGLGHVRSQWELAEVPWGGAKLVQVECGIFHSLVLDEEGTVWETGLSRFYEPQSTFKQVLELPKIIQVAAGSPQSAAVDIDGNLWVWTTENSLSWASTTPRKVEGLQPLRRVACGWGFLVGEAEEGLWVLGITS